MTTEITTTADTMLAMIERVSSNPDADIAKMEKLLDMRERELTRLSRQQFNQSYADMQSELPIVAKTHRNAHTKSDYAKIEDINIQIMPVLKKFGFGVSFRVVKQDIEGITVSAILKHRAGHEESTELWMPLDNKGAQGTVNKTSVQATGSTLTYAKRYALCALLNISTGDDTDGNSEPKLLTPLQKELLQGKLSDCTEATRLWFLEKYQSADMVTQNQFDALMASLEIAIKKANAAKEEV